MKHKIINILFIVFFDILFIFFMSDRVYAIDNVTGEFEIKTQTKDICKNGQDIKKGTELIFHVSSVEINETLTEEPTYNFYYILEGDNRRNYIAKNVNSDFVWDTTDLCEFGKYEMHMTINICTNSDITEYLCENNIILNMVDVYDIVYIANYEDSDLYAMKFLYKYNEKTFIKGSLFEREGYKFCGWSEKENDFDKIYKPKTAIEMKKNLKLYAIWKKVGNNKKYDLKNKANYKNEISNDTLNEENRKIYKEKEDLENKTEENLDKEKENQVVDEENEKRKYDLGQSYEEKVHEVEENTDAMNIAENSVNMNAKYKEYVNAKIICRIIIVGILIILVVGVYKYRRKIKNKED